MPKGADGLVLLPYFMGEAFAHMGPQSPRFFRAVLLPHARAHAFRSVLEGIGYALEHHAEILREQGLMPKRIVAVDAARAATCSGK